MSTGPSLADLLKAAVQKANQGQADAKQVERISAAVRQELSKRAETSKPMSCPHCGEPLPESWRTDDVTGNSDSNDDPDNEQDNGAQPDDYDNRKAHRPLNGMTRDQVIASLGKIRC
jgi:hypothetical protein